MEITVKRIDFQEKATIGELYVDGEFICYTLEDTVRLKGVKIPKETAIPAGRYRIVMDFSNRFKRTMPHILDVPMFEGIRIHSGNTDKDTEGCILVGLTKSDKDFIGQSKAAYIQFIPYLLAGLKEGEVYITIS